MTRPRPRPSIDLLHVSRKTTSEAQADPRLLRLADIRARPKSRSSHPHRQALLYASSGAPRAEPVDG